jgi:Predicted membrane protein
VKFWLPVLTIALGTYIYRYSFIGGGLKSKMPDLIRRGLEFVPVSVLAALVATGFFLDEQKAFNLYLPSLVAAACATAVALRFGRDLLTILAGLAVYWLMEYLWV